VLARAERVGLRLEMVGLDDRGGALAALAAGGSEENRERGTASGRAATLAELVDLAG
jgi:uncharacterized protein YbjT (DUF2867 family)